ncbi:fumarylacetoacetate hydrolase family protein [Campylobacter sp. CCUG 57310]|uniref:fumarylacetoacetate hydrolase family protein n=1 Tax=Campylobacter sp. CCUG 57310 TaxID=2517362 RepID=UPI001566452B|nr:fumarylacetoacetate hydrolase family protein [Campylobacter sp. CCUG 57310]QKF92351.1 fumarylacetoacetate hydrolase family protein [Campylobacter sp. CCUG 57310]
MKFVTFFDGCVKTGIVSSDNELISFDEIGLKFKDLNDFIERASDKDYRLLSVFEAQARGLKIGEAKLLAPIIKPRQDIICLGINYMDHAAESAKFKGEKFDSKREYPVYFSKRVNEAVGHGGEILAHERVTQKLDYEVELALIIKKDAKNVSAKDAKDYIFGYTILNDFSARDLQIRHKQFYFGKSLDTHCAMGPAVVTADELDSSNLTIKCYVNGELRQNSNTSNMIFKERYVIEELSSAMTLKAGTIISLGTPSGVGMGFEPPKFLKSGDVVRCEIEGIGVLENFIS